jgi:hypothetical protein
MVTTFIDPEGREQIPNNEMGDSIEVTKEGVEDCKKGLGK